MFSDSLVLTSSQVTWILLRWDHTVTRIQARLPWEESGGSSRAITPVQEGQAVSRDRRGCAVWLVKHVCLCRACGREGNGFLSSSSMSWQTAYFTGLGPWRALVWLLEMMFLISIQQVLMGKGKSLPLGFLEQLPAGGGSAGGHLSP